jgi:acyl-CoA reductase-like NAD-dependent aldehyde dehydrogenase
VAKIWTRDLRSAHQPARKLQAGWITINGGREGALSFTEIKSISVGY